jgi:transposase-like protein
MQLEATTGSRTQAMGALADETSTRRPGRRPKLTPSQQDEVVRLYADPTTSIAAIRERFGIQDATLYRLLLRHGVARRGRNGARGGPGRARATSPRTAAPRATTTDGVKHSFSVSFRAVSVFHGRSALDVVHALERLGATDIEEIRRQ